MWIGTAARCQELDRQAMAGGVGGEALMHEAATAVWREACSIPGTVTVLCGPGKNGADGFVVGRLALAEGRQAVCVQATDRLAPEAERERGRFVAAGGRVLAASELWPEGGVVVDALLGIGARPELSGEILRLVERTAGRKVVAVDVPTGIDADTGRAVGPHVRADVTVTFGLLKPGLFLREGLEAAGGVVLAELSYPQKLLEQPTGLIWANQNVVRHLLPVRAVGAHKGSAGRVLVVAGSETMPGAAVLATLGALRGGAGLVHCLAPSSVLSALAAQVPEALLSNVNDLWLRATEADAVVVGPGLGDDAKALLTGLPAATCPLVIDASALSHIDAVRADALPRCVLTPHPGEAGRLLGVSSTDIQNDRLGSVAALTAKFGCAVVLKGARTLVASPGRPTAVVPTGNSGMATAGSGDVLAGLIGSLLGQGCPPPDAALLGAWLHGAAGDLAASEIGKIGLRATDFASRIPVVRDTLASS